MTATKITASVTFPTLPGLFTLAFVILKLCGVISWPWLWVLAPTWIFLGLVEALSLALLVIALVAALLK